MKNTVYITIILSFSLPSICFCQAQIRTYDEHLRKEVCRISDTLIHYIKLDKINLKNVVLGKVEITVVDSLDRESEHTIREYFESEIKGCLLSNFNEEVEFRLLERELLKDIIREIELNDSGAVQGDAASIGKLRGAEILIRPKITVFPDGFKLFLFAIDLEKGEYINCPSDYIYGNYAFLGIKAMDTNPINSENIFTTPFIIGSLIFEPHFPKYGNKNKCYSFLVKKYGKKKKSNY